MNKKTISYSIAMCLLGLSIFSACAKEDLREHTATTISEQQPSATTIEMDLSGEIIDEDEIDISTIDTVSNDQTTEPTRNLTYEFVPNNGKSYPKMQLQKNPGETTSMIVVIRNSSLPQKYVIKETTWTVDKDKKLRFLDTDFSLTAGNHGFTETDIKSHPNDFRLLCIVGATPVKQNNEVVGYTYNGFGKHVVRQGSSLQLNTLFFSQAKGNQTQTNWVPISLSENKKFFKATDFKLVPQGSVFMIRVKNESGQKINLRGLKIESQKLTMGISGSLTGTINPSTNHKPEIRPNKATVFEEDKIFDQTINLPNQTTTDYILLWTWAKSNAGNFYVSALFNGQSGRYELNWEGQSGGSNSNEVESINASYRNKFTHSVSNNRFYALNNVVFRKRQLRVPIEAMLATEPADYAIHVGTGSQSWADQTYTNTDGRVYSLPTQDEWRVFIPNEYRPYNEGNGNRGRPLYGRLSFKSDHTYNNLTEKRVDIFGRQIDNTTATYKNVSTEYHPTSTQKSYVSYAIRFEGSEYRSAFRYEYIVPNDVPIGETGARVGPKAQKGPRWLKITERMIPRNKYARVDINTIANEQYWQNGPEFEQAEATRILQCGRYWSSSKNGDLWTVAKICVYQDTGAAHRPSEAFVADRPAWMERASRPKNTTNTSAFYVTRDNGLFRPNNNNRGSNNNHGGHNGNRRRRPH